MVRKAKELSALEVRRLVGPKRHAVGGVAGLYLYLNDKDGSSWVLRVTVGSAREYVGLGPYPEVSLAQAREKAREAKDLFRQGVNPKVRRRELASELVIQQSRLKTFKEAATAYIEAHGETWKNAKHRSQWSSTLETYAFPLIGSLLVKDVDQDSVLRVLEPIWKTKNETASRLRGRIQAVLDWATVRGYRQGDNPALWKGRLDKLLPASSKIAPVKHHRALDYRKMAEFMRRLRQQKGVSAKALEFAILCAARSGEVRGARWSEVDIKGEVWTVPAERMKAGREHRVPLSPSALQLLKGLPKVVGCDLIFPGRNEGPLSDMSLIKVLRDMEVDAVPHGFRSTFRDWVGEVTSFQREVAEQALAHVLESKVEAAYRRGDALDKRRTMMKAWAAFCDDQPVQQLADVFKRSIYKTKPFM